MELGARFWYTHLTSACFKTFPVFVVIIHLTLTFWFFRSEVIWGNQKNWIFPLCISMIFRIFLQHFTFWNSNSIIQDAYAALLWKILWCWAFVRSVLLMDWLVENPPGRLVRSDTTPGDPKFVLDISSSWDEIRLHTKIQAPGLSKVP
jgi:hypothetical protein